MSVSERHPIDNISKYTGAPGLRSTPSCCGSLGSTAGSVDFVCLAWRVKVEWRTAFGLFHRGANFQPLKVWSERSLPRTEVSDWNSSALGTTLSRVQLFLHPGKSPAAQCWNFQAIVPWVAGISRLTDWGGVVCQSFWVVRVISWCWWLFQAEIKFSPLIKRKK